MKAFDDFMGRMVAGMAGIGCIIVVCIFTMIVIDVTMRTVGFTPPSFTLTIVEYALLYFTMCAAPYLVRNKGHVFIEAFISILPVPVRRVLEKIVYLACVLASILFTYLSAQLLIEALQSGQMDVRGIDMPYWTLFIPMPFGFGLVAYEFGRYLFGSDTMYNYDLSTVRDSV